MSKIFLSYSHKNRTQVNKLAEDLKNHGIDVWYDEWKILPGHPIVTKIQEGIQESDYMAIWLTEEAINSGWVEKEWQTKYVQEVNSNASNIIPLLADDVDIPLFLQNKMPADFRDYETGLKSIIDRIQYDNTLVDDIRNSSIFSWESYGWNFKIENFRIAYIPLFNNLDSEIFFLDKDQIEIRKDYNRYSLPKEFEKIQIPTEFTQSQACRLSHYYIKKSNLLSLTFAQTAYEDYLKSGEILDFLIENEQNITYRDKFGKIILMGEKNLRPFPLSNICGVGLFTITSDDYIVLSRHPNNSHVYPGRLTYSASGIMKWGAFPDPFTLIILKAYEEINHQVDINSLKLIDFGADSRKLYFQFSFIETSRVSLTEIQKISNSMVNLKFIPNEPDSIAKDIVNNIWEPSAESSLLMYAIKIHGKDVMTTELNKYLKEWKYKSMKDEWDYRSNRPGLLPDMSVRYPQHELNLISQNYIHNILDFISDDINDKNVLEIGCGTGRISEAILPVVSHLTCNDMSEAMIEHHKQRIDRISQDNVKNKVTRICRFAQDLTIIEFDVIISSLVLIHNVDETMFNNLICHMCKLSNIIYIFEDITQNRQTSPHTKLRNEKEIIKKFEANNFFVLKKEYNRLHEDKIIFLKFCKNSSEA